jgi:hypothetical protein
MQIHVLFGQRKERYAGEYGPVIIAADDEYSAEDNPDWLLQQKAEAEADGDFESVAIITFEVSQDEIMKRLRPQLEPLAAKVV